ncbi:hypothetical protein K523DRAFT_367241 [Schizophyllum commune Tattone D]|nr:hypothetical protein K523DRAFT_367241 [Schizophyllum commune Tattone D]
MGSSCGAARSAAAFLCLIASLGAKMRKSTSMRPRSARELLDDRPDCGDGTGSGAKRRCCCVFESNQLHGQDFCKSSSNAPSFRKVLSGLCVSPYLGSNELTSREQGPFPSLSKCTFDCATSPEPPAPLATPSILAFNFNIARALGTEITVVFSRRRRSRAYILRAHYCVLVGAAAPPGR